MVSATLDVVQDVFSVDMLSERQEQQGGGESGPGVLHGRARHPSQLHKQRSAGGSTRLAAPCRGRLLAGGAGLGQRRLEGASGMVLTASRCLAGGYLPEICCLQVLFVEPVGQLRRFKQLTSLTVQRGGMEGADGCAPGSAHMKRGPTDGRFGTAVPN
jgi:hypothetical protein